MGKDFLIFPTAQLDGICDRSQVDLRWIWAFFTLLPTISWKKGEGLEPFCRGKWERPVLQDLKGTAFESNMETSAVEKAPTKRVSEPKTLKPSHRPTQKKTWSFLSFHPSANCDNFHIEAHYCACGFRLAGLVFHGRHTEVKCLFFGGDSSEIRRLFFWGNSPYVWNLPHFLEKSKTIIYTNELAIGWRPPVSLAKLANENPMMK